MYKNILVAVDNSPYSEACCNAAVSLAQAFGAGVTGCHAYPARLHERRFRQMEATLPEEYLADEELERQRAIHQSLISLGLQLISDCYLDALERQCDTGEVPFARKTFDGKNWERLAEEINGSPHNLAILGSHGHGTSRVDSVGSVCLRVLRRTRTDTLVIKDPRAFGNGAGRSILVALDGSQESFGALEAALALGKAYRRPVEAVAAYDPYFHYAVFNSMVEVLSSEAARVFRFKEQERLHEEIIDSGLARLYRTHLEVAERVAQAEGVSLSTTLLAGRAAEELASYAQRSQPWLICVGRIGVHSRESMDIGSVTEHLLRFAPSNLLVASRRVTPPLDLWSASGLRWTEEAEAVLLHAPQEHRGPLRLLAQQLAREQGHTVATASLVRQAMETMRPSPSAAQRMGEAALSVAVETLRKQPGPVFLCPGCGHAAREQRPVACPACGENGQRFLAVDPQSLEAAAATQGGVEDRQAFDGARVRWSRAALQSLRHIEDAAQRRKARLRVEKAARLAKMPVITLEFTLRTLPDAATPQDSSRKTSPSDRVMGDGE